MSSPYKPERAVSSAKIKDAIVSEMESRRDNAQVASDEYWIYNSLARKGSWSRLYRAKLPESRKNVRGYASIREDVNVVCVSDEHDAEILELYVVKDAKTERQRLGVDEVILGD